MAGTSSESSRNSNQISVQLLISEGLPRIPALIATEYCFLFKKALTATSAVAYYLCERNKGYNDIVGSLLYQLV